MRQAVGERTVFFEVISENLNYGDGWPWRTPHRILIPLCYDRLRAAGY